MCFLLSSLKRRAYLASLFTVIGERDVGLGCADRTTVCMRVRLMEEELLAQKEDGLQVVVFEESYRVF